MNFKCIHFFGFIFFQLLAGLSASGQGGTSGEIFRIDRIIPDDEIKKIRIQLTALNNRGEALSPYIMDESRYEIRENRSGATSKKYSGERMQVKEPKLLIDNVLDNSVELQTVRAPMQVLFLLDISGSMNKDKVTGVQISAIEARRSTETRLSAAKDAIRDVLSSKALVGADVQIAFFDNQVTQDFPLDIAIFERDIADNYIVDPANKHTALYRALYEKTKALSVMSGKKVIILLTDGKNDPRNKPISIRLTEEEILDQIAQLDSATFQIYPIGIGQERSRERDAFLKKVTAATKNTEDKYDGGTAPTDLGTALTMAVNSLTSNVEIILTPEKGDVFGLENREYIVSFNNNKYSALKETVIGTNHGWIPNPKYRIIPSTQLFVIGLLFIGGLLGLLILLVPLIVDYTFKKKHLKKYSAIKRPGYTPKDPLMLTTFQDNDLVVKFGNKMMLYDTWKYIKEEKQGDLSKYSEFFEGQLKGGFFSQIGVYKRLNWLWFGAIGGFLTWVLLSLFENLDTTALLGFLQKTFDSSHKEISYSLEGRVILGFAMGIGITLALCIVEELGQSRQISIQRILLRVLIGMLITPLVFLIEGLITTSFLNHNYLGGLVGFTLIGFAMGWVLTLYSSIEDKSGIKGGALAGLVAFHIYFLLVFTPVRDFINADISKILNLILFGGVLGFVMFSIVEKLEVFEIVYLSPAAFAGQVNGISKFLKSEKNSFILIGNHPKECAIYVKWEDPSVQKHHAKLYYDRGKVYIEPYQGEILLNGVPLQKKALLRNKDKFLLGPKSISTMQFRSKKIEADDFEARRENQVASSNRQGPRPKPNIAIRKEIEVRKKS